MCYGNTLTQRALPFMFHECSLHYPKIECAAGIHCHYCVQKLCMCVLFPVVYLFHHCSMTGNNGYCLPWQAVPVLLRSNHIIECSIISQCKFQVIYDGSGVIREVTKEYKLQWEATTLFSSPTLCILKRVHTVTSCRYTNSAQLLSRTKGCPQQLYPSPRHSKDKDKGDIVAVCSTFGLFASSAQKSLANDHPLPKCAFSSNF